MKCIVNPAFWRTESWTAKLTQVFSPNSVPRISCFPPSLEQEKLVFKCVKHKNFACGAQKCWVRFTILLKKTGNQTCDIRDVLSTFMQRRSEKVWQSLLSERKVRITVKNCNWKFKWFGSYLFFSKNWKTAVRSSNCNTKFHFTFSKILVFFM